MGISTGSKRAPAPPDRVDTATQIALWDVVGSLVLLVALAVSQPVLDLLSRNLAFFTAHQTIPLDVLGLAVMLTIVLPLVVVLPVVVLMKLAQRVGLVVYGVVLGLLAAAASSTFCGASHRHSVAGCRPSPWSRGSSRDGLSPLSEPADTCCVGAR